MLPGAADQPKTGAWRMGSGAALRIAGLEAEETPPHTHTEIPTYNLFLIVSDYPFLCLSAFFCDFPFAFSQFLSL